MRAVLTSCCTAAIADKKAKMPIYGTYLIYYACITKRAFCCFQCYIQYMKYCRRAEGTSSARAVFKRAREDPRTSYHVYVAAALMEYYCTKDKKIAANVFELGFKKFKANEQFVLAYVDYLSHLNGEFPPRKKETQQKLMDEKSENSKAFVLHNTTTIINLTRKILERAAVGKVFFSPSLSSFF